MRTAGAVLCGGASRRMGRDKALVEIDGLPMAERVARVLQTAGARPVYFVGGDRAALEPLGRAVLADAFPGQGPAGGVITALRAGATGVIVAACDLVDVDVVTVCRVMGAGGTRVRVAYSDRLEPALAWWPHEVLTTVEHSFASGVRALHEVLDAVGFDPVPVEVTRLRNVNTPGEVTGR
jgi:molybdenum cofactor guanylyltransferase